RQGAGGFPQGARGDNGLHPHTVSALLPHPTPRMAPKGVAPPADRLAWAILVRLARGDATLYTGSPTGAVSRHERYLPSVAMRAVQGARGGSGAQGTGRERA